MPKRTAEHMAAQRERIVRGVIACIADKGIERTSISDICRKVKLSTGSLYLHFQNKDDLVAEALRYGSLTENSLPDSWDELLAMIASLDDQLGFDITTIARNRLHLHAESVHPGALHDIHKPHLERNLRILSGQLQLLADRGDIGLRMSAMQTARSINAFIDGMLWIALATDRPLDELKPELVVGLSCLVDAPHKKSPIELA